MCTHLQGFWTQTYDCLCWRRKKHQVSLSRERLIPMPMRQAVTSPSAGLRGFDKPASPDSSRAHPQWHCPLPTCTAPACCAHNVCQQLYWEQAPWTRPVEQDRFLRTTKSRLSECCPQQWSSNRANPALWGDSQMLTNTYMYIQTHSCALHTLKKLPAIICNWE